MDSSLHMHVASLKIQDDIHRADHARLVKQASVQPRGHRVMLRRLFTPSLRRAH
jgi:hypothetical protein